MEHSPATIFGTGAKRSSDCDDLKYSLIPTCATRRWAKRLALGAKLHGRDNWKKGFPYSACVDHLMEHLAKWLEGDSSEDHLAAILCNVGFLAWYEEHLPEVDDLKRGVGDGKHARVQPQAPTVVQSEWHLPKVSEK